MSAPALLMEVSTSIAALFSSSHPLATGGLDHRVLAADAVRRYGQVEPRPSLADDVEIWERGLHHDDVCPFADVSPRSPSSPPSSSLRSSGTPSCRRTRASTPRPPGTVRRTTRRTLRNIPSRASLEVPSRLGPCVWHRPARPSSRSGNDVRSSPRILHGSLCQQREGHVVVDAAVLQDSAVPVGGVLAEADVRR